MKLKDHFSKYMKVAANPPSMTSQDVARTQEAILYMNEFINPEYRNGNILVIGAGDGVETQYALTLGFKTVQGLVYLPEEAIQQEMTVGDMHEMDILDNSIDFVYSKETLEHALSPFIALCEINRVLKTGGRFAIAISQGIRKQRDWYHFSCFPSWVWLDLFRKAELSVETIAFDGPEQYHNAIYTGGKIKDKDFNKPIELYSLEDYYNSIPKKELLR